MAFPAGLRVVLVKPSKYSGQGGVLERFRLGCMPNGTLPHLRSLTPPNVEGVPVTAECFDECVETDLGYLRRLAPTQGERTLVALVGVQSHQFPRAIDLAAIAHTRGALVVMGGPHPMTCDTHALQGRGPSFCQGEAEATWPGILADALRGELRPVYGEDARWQTELRPPPVEPLEPRQMRRYALRLGALYPARGCPFDCHFCSVVRIAGRTVRAQPIETTLAGLRAIRRAGVRVLMFTSDNFNKYPGVTELLEAMIAADLRVPFMAQADAQLVRDPSLVELLARAGCFQLFVGVESFSHAALRGVGKRHNRPEDYRELARHCRAHGVLSHFSSILGFPDDDRRRLAEHRAAIEAVGPDLASFHVLTPLPGTTQYEDFRARGLLVDRDLGRYDATRLVWRHPHLDAQELDDALFGAYRSFYRPARIGALVRNALARRRDVRVHGYTLSAVYAAFCRTAAHLRLHPMSAGLGRVRLDRASDHAEVRRVVFGIDRVPLPENLPQPKPHKGALRA